MGIAGLVRANRDSCRWASLMTWEYAHKEFEAPTHLLVDVLLGPDDE
jgi:hypothetical protein